ncbi:MAG TPA: helical backbone metal receptor [Polyangiaceae bacterium]|nr:helical backbone metal receptor [Polyangiaceae bacterium]
MRIVALTCSNTEIVCALGCSDQLVGVDDHSDFPEPVVARCARVGPDLGIDVARVAALKPDLVLASLTVPGHERVIEQLERAGLPFIAPEPRSLADVCSNIRTIAELLGVTARAKALIAELEPELFARPAASGLRLLVEWWPKPIIVPGRDSWVTELLLAAGAINPLAQRPVKSQPLTDADAALLEPDASVIAWCGVRTEKYRRDVVLRRPDWQHLKLVREGRVYRVPEAWLGRPGPRLVLGVRALRQIVLELAAAP